MPDLEGQQHSETKYYGLAIMRIVTMNMLLLVVILVFKIYAEYDTQAQFKSLFSSDIKAAAERQAQQEQLMSFMQSVANRLDARLTLKNNGQVALEPRPIPAPTATPAPPPPKPKTIIRYRARPTPTPWYKKMF